MPRKPELMSPAGYWPQVHAAMDAGADAVYFGLKHFSARAKVGFDLAELPELMRTLHTRGVRGFLTFNTLVFQHELREAFRAVEAAAAAGVDALIIQDIGVLRTLRQIAPDIEIHASTQTSITDIAGVEFALEMGANRVTLARELSIEEIAAIYSATRADLEIFVHGALCVAYSGQCFSSEAWGGRSANRGQCAQACRLPYELVVDGDTRPLGDARYLLSPGDLYGLRHVPRIVEAGVSCLKIEGRYKDANYVALTTRAYREALDGVPDPAREAQLEQVYSRGLGPYFLSGVNHQTVVRGRAPRHRGMRVGRVERVLADGVAVALEQPVKPGDGLVFDAADWRSPQEREEGGRVYQADGGTLRFANGAIDFSRIRPGDLVWRSHDPALEKAASSFAPRRHAVDVTVQAAPGQPLRTRWSSGPHTDSADSAEPLAPAGERQLDIATLRAQFGRLGNSPFELGPVDLTCAAPVFAPVSMLNALRRQAVERLLAERVRTVPRTFRPFAEPPAAAAEDAGVPQLHLLVRTPAQLEAAIGVRPASITLDYLDLYGLRPSVRRVRESGIAVRVASPRILKPGEARIVNFLVDLDCPILVRASGALQALRPSGRELTGDFSLNTANALTATAFLELGVHRLTPTHDCNAAQIAGLARRIGAGRIEAIAYQHLPVFHTEHCVFCRFLSTGTTWKDCGRPCETHQVALRDEKQRLHPVLADVGCRNTVFGAEAQHASHHMNEWLEAGIAHYRLEFVHETGEQVRAIANAFGEALAGRTTWNQLAAALPRIAPEGITEGSLFVPKDYALFPILQ